MVVITVTITESSEQIVSGIPKTVSMATSIPASIFYTFDGTTPDASSSLYAGGDLEIPTHEPTATFKVFATNGVDSSSIITRTYYPDETDSIRRPFDSVTNAADVASDTNNNFPYSDYGPNVPVEYGSVGLETVDSPDVAGESAGYDGTATGTSSAETDQTYPDNYEVIYSDSDSVGERGHGIGTLPSQVTVRNEGNENSQTNMNESLFNPKAMVIYQDNTQEPYDNDILQTNRPFFSLENPETDKDGALLSSAPQYMAPTGGFVTSRFNPTENVITYYYFDSQALRWIISKEPYVPSIDSSKALSRIIISSRSSGSNRVFKWYPFKRSRLI
jgi:hypothetical protein